MDTEFFLMISLIAGFLVTLALFAYVYFRGIVLINTFQEMKYDPKKFLTWVLKARNFEKHATLVLLMSYIGWYFMTIFLPQIAAPLFFAFAVVALLIGAFRDQRKISRTPEPSIKGKREKKILYFYLILTGIYFAGFFSAGDDMNMLLLLLAFLAFLQAPPIFIIAANFVIRPFINETV